MLTREMLASVLTFNAEKGRFFWLGAKRGQTAGKEAGSFDAHGYGQIRVFGRVWKEHRLVWLWMHGEMPVGQIDHINHDRRDNRPENLRTVDNVLNHRNRPIQSNNTSGAVGVSFDRGAYVAYISVTGAKKHLGRFKTLDEAVAARQAAMQEHGFHENHGKSSGRPKHRVLKEMLHEAGICTPPGRISMQELKQMKERK